MEPSRVGGQTEQKLQVWPILNRGPCGFIQGLQPQFRFPTRGWPAVIDSTSLPWKPSPHLSPNLMASSEFQEIDLSIDQSSEPAASESVSISHQDVHSKSSDFNSMYMRYNAMPSTATSLSLPQENFINDVTLIGELPNAGLSNRPSKSGINEEAETVDVGFQLTLLSPGSDPTSENSPSDSESQEPVSSRSRHISATKDVFSDQEKFAYVGLCKLFLVDQANSYPFKFPEFSSANASYTLFGKKIMRKLYTHMAINEDGNFYIFIFVETHT